MIDEKKVKNIAKLARIELTEKEIKKYKEDFSSILNYFEKLKKIDFSGSKELSEEKFNCNVAREDEVKKISFEQRKKIIELFPEEKEDYLKVKSIF